LNKIFAKHMPGRKISDSLLINIHRHDQTTWYFKLWCILFMQYRNITHKLKHDHNVKIQNPKAFIRPSVLNQRYHWIHNKKNWNFHPVDYFMDEHVNL
jgi:hypothetical protein